MEPIMDCSLYIQIDSYRTIVTKVGSKNGDGLPDIDFRCTDPSLKAGKNLQLVHPVSLGRISGSAVPNSVWFFENQFLMPLKKYIKPPHGQANLAFTFCPSTVSLKWQKQLTGSGKPWCDIVLQGVLSNPLGRTKGRVKDAVRDWSVATLTRKHFSLFDIEPATITIMHELTHSIAMGLDEVIRM